MLVNRLWGCCGGGKAGLEVRLTRKSTLGYRYAIWKRVFLGPCSKFEREFPTRSKRGVSELEGLLVRKYGSDGLSGRSGGLGKRGSTDSEPGDLWLPEQEKTPQCEQQEPSSLRLSFT